MYKFEVQKTEIQDLFVFVKAEFLVIAISEHLNYLRNTLKYGDLSEEVYVAYDDLKKKLLENLKAFECEGLIP